MPPSARPYREPPHPMDGVMFRVWAPSRRPCRSGGFQQLTARLASLCSKETATGAWIKAAP